jgi:hypothetical protein
MAQFLYRHIQAALGYEDAAGEALRAAKGILEGDSRSLENRADSFNSWEAIRVCRESWLRVPVRRNCKLLGGGVFFTLPGPKEPVHFMKSFDSHFLNFERGSPFFSLSTGIGRTISSLRG